MPHRFSEFRSPDWVPASYANIFSHSRHSNGREFLMAAPFGEPIELLFRLARSTASEFYVLWVLHTPRGGSRRGRYQSPLLPTAGVLDLLQAHRPLLSQDGRQDLWLHSPKAEATLVWDRHELLYLYGPLKRLETELLDAGLHQGAPVIPVPHAHNYHQEFDLAERTLAAALDWRISPLQPQDEQFS